MAVRSPSVYLERGKTQPRRRSRRLSEAAADVEQLQLRHRRRREAQRSAPRRGRGRRRAREVTPAFGGRLASTSELRSSRTRRSSRRDVLREAAAASRERGRMRSARSDPRRLDAVGRPSRFGASARGGRSGAAAQAAAELEWREQHLAVMIVGRRMTAPVRTVAARGTSRRLKCAARRSVVAGRLVAAAPSGLRPRPRRRRGRARELLAARRAASGPRGGGRAPIQPETSAGGGGGGQARRRRAPPAFDSSTRGGQDRRRRARRGHAAKTDAVRKAGGGGRPAPASRPRRRPTLARSSASMPTRGHSLPRPAPNRRD